MEHQPPFDTRGLQSCLKRHLSIPGQSLLAVPVGQGYSNPTFMLRAGDEDLPYVLRKQPDGPLPRSAHAIDREFRVMSALASTDVPVPRMLYYCEDPSIIGTPFFIMERVEGRVFTDNAIPAASPDARAAIYAAMADILVKLHNVDIDSVGLRDFGKAGDFFERQISTWSRQHEALRLPDSDDLDRLIEWLRINRPSSSDEASLIHGDYKLGNLMFHPEQPQVVALLDWELSTLGHPLADLGYNLLSWVQRSDELNGLADLDLAAMGIPAMTDYAALYLAERGLPTQINPFFIAFACFRVAVIFEGVVRREAQGARRGMAATRSSEDHVRIFARHGLEMAGI